jgi:hypothetical protein
MFNNNNPEINDRNQTSFSNAFVEYDIWHPLRTSNVAETLIFLYKFPYLIPNSDNDIRKTVITLLMKIGCGGPTSEILALRQRQEDHKFEVSLSFIAYPVLKMNNNNNNNKNNSIE